MPASHKAPNRVVASVIVPARNEEAALGRCLQSLVSQAGIAFEVLVVDDASTDRTRQIAESFPAVRVVTAGPLPPGWSGKNNAVTAGARAARGEWLLFTDADTVHLPGSLARSLEEAERQGAALLSYSPGQEVRGFWEKAIMPVIFAELATKYPPSQVSDPASPVAAANGQYLLVTREAYDAVGGHAAVAGSLLEDVALAQAIKRSGRKIVFRFGGDAVRTRMYRSFHQLREGWTKNLALLFGSPGRLAMVRMLEFALISGSALSAGWAFYEGSALALGFALALFAVGYGRFFARIRKAHFGGDSTAFAIMGLPLFAYLLLRSRLAHKHGTVTWKGRRYQGEAGNKSAPRHPSAALGLFETVEEKHGLSHS